MTTSTNIISATSATAATSWNLGFRASGASGQTAVVGICSVAAGVNIDTSSPFVDSKGNTWTVVPNTHTLNGANGNDQIVLTCRIAFPIGSGDYLPIPVTGGSFSSIAAMGSVLSDDLVPFGVSTVHAQVSATIQNDSGTTTTATQVLWAWNQVFSSASPGASYTDGHFIASLGNPARSGYFNAVLDGFYAPGAAGTWASQCTWSSSYTGNSVVVVFDAPAAQPRTVKIKTVMQAVNRAASW